MGHRCGGGRQGGPGDHGVEFVYDVDKEAFREATQPMIEAYEEEYPGVKTLMDTIEKARGEE